MNQRDSIITGLATKAAAAAVATAKGQASSINDLYGKADQHCGRIVDEMLSERSEAEWGYSVERLSKAATKAAKAQAHDTIRAAEMRVRMAR